MGRETKGRGRQTVTGTLQAARVMLKINVFLL